MIYIETEHLLLRDWCTTDLPTFIEMNADPEVMRYFPNTLTAQETELFYHKINQEMKKNGYGLFAVEEREAKEFIGFIGFHKADFAADFTPCIEIGWRLNRDSWGNGYATEGAKACLAYGFRQLGFDKVYSFTAKINHPSEQVMKKIGMDYIKDFDHPKLKAGHPLQKHVLYQLENKML